MKEFCFCLSLYLIFFVSCSEKIVFEVFEIQDSTKSLLELPKPKQEARKKSKKSITESIEEKLLKIGKKIKSCLGNPSLSKYKSKVNWGELVLKRLIKTDNLYDYIIAKDSVIYKLFDGEYKYIIHNKENKKVWKIIKEQNYLIEKNQVLTYDFVVEKGVMNIKWLDKKEITRHKIKFKNENIRKIGWIISSNKRRILLQTKYKLKIFSNKKQISKIFCYKNRELTEIGKIKDYFNLGYEQGILRYVLALSYDKQEVEYFLDIIKSKLMIWKRNKLRIVEFSRAGNKFIVFTDNGLFQYDNKKQDFIMINSLKGNLESKMKCVDKFCFIYVVVGWPQRIVKQKIKVYNITKRKFIREYIIPKNEFYTKMRIHKNRLILSGKGTMIDNKGNVRIYKIK